MPAQHAARDQRPDSGWPRDQGAAVPTACRAGVPGPSALPHPHWRPGLAPTVLTSERRPPITRARGQAGAPEPGVQHPHLSAHCWMQLVRCAVTFLTPSSPPRQQLSSRGRRAWRRLQALLSPSWLLVSASARISSARPMSSGAWTRSTSSSRRFCSQAPPVRPGRVSPRPPATPPCGQGTPQNLPEGCAGPCPARFEECGCRPRGSPGRPRGQTWRKRGDLAEHQACLQAEGGGGWGPGQLSGAAGRPT